MIRFADIHTQQLVRDMWKICFCDTDEFMDLYFSRKYKNENTLVCFEGDTAVASLQMLPYDMRFYGRIIATSYVSGACTLPEHRRKGYMEKLLIAAMQVITERNIPLTTLIPAEKWLYGFYAKYGYERTFERHGENIALKEIIGKYGNDTEAAYREFVGQYQQNDFCILKTKEDFDVIVEEYRQIGCPEKQNLGGMARVMDIPLLLSYYAENNPSKDFKIRVTDEIMRSDAVYHIAKGTVSETNPGKYDLDTDINLLTRLLMGFHVGGLSPQYAEFFKEHQPVMNLMLE